MSAIVLLLVSLSTSANSQPFVAEYYVSGTNLDTNERVIGYLSGNLGQPEVGGIIYDRGDRWAVVGHIDGKGLFLVRSLCCRYSVEVVDEVSGNKLQNRYGSSK